mmetsp:Transcript_24129/g.47399  ORF Transcript_24129/g.47399 Transcript_24129/m.47399 type:complete len:405 (+) Transcript_24129:1520-2734(+)
MILFDPFAVVDRAFRLLLLEQLKDLFLVGEDQLLPSVGTEGLEGLDGIGVGLHHRAERAEENGVAETGPEKDGLQKLFDPATTAAIVATIEAATGAAVGGSRSTQIAHAHLNEVVEGRRSTGPWGGVTTEAVFAVLRDLPSTICQRVRARLCGEHRVQVGVANGDVRDSGVAIESVDDLHGFAFDEFNEVVLDLFKEFVGDPDGHEDLEELHCLEAVLDFVLLGTRDAQNVLQRSEEREGSAKDGVISFSARLLLLCCGELVGHEGLEGLDERDVGLDDRSRAGRGKQQLLCELLDRHVEEGAQLGGRHENVGVCSHDGRITGGYVEGVLQREELRNARRTLTEGLRLDHPIGFGKCRKGEQQNDDVAKHCCKPAKTVSGGRGFLLNVCGGFVRGFVRALFVGL